MLITCMMHSLEAINELINAEKQHVTWDGRILGESRLVMLMNGKNNSDLSISLFLMPTTIL